MAHAGLQPVECGGELDGAEPLGGLHVRLRRLRVLDHVAVEALAVADGRLEADRVLNELEQLADALGREAGLLRDLLMARIAVQLLREHAAAAGHAPYLLGDVHGQADRPALLGERARDGLADPPGRVRRKLEAELVVELLDRPDQAEVALLDQVEQGHAGLRVVTRDRHHEPEVALDQLPLRRLVALVLEACELPLLRRREQAAVTDLAHVELERVLRGLRCGGLLGLFGVGDLLRRGQKLQPRLGRRLEDRLGSVRFHLPPGIGLAALRLEESVPRRRNPARVVLTSGQQFASTLLKWASIPADNNPRIRHVCAASPVTA